jgi:hypothetical protein
MVSDHAAIRLADEYDAAQDRGEVGKSGARTDLVPSGNEVIPSASDLGLSRKQIHEARSIRDADKAVPATVPHSPRAANTRRTPRPQPKAAEARHGCALARRGAIPPPTPLAAVPSEGVHPYAGPRPRGFERVSRSRNRAWFGIALSQQTVRCATICLHTCNHL